uniref:Uncharacterized protein n=1 Tax=Physcomitrium patens TaxID=3218 RepID=A0A2K1K019_PHYPA|nr:hypothetical protein PHYPA_014235 [Physcomitrium patens]
MINTLGLQNMNWVGLQPGNRCGSGNWSLSDMHIDWIISPNAGPWATFFYSYAQSQYAMINTDSPRYKNPSSCRSIP